MATSVEMMTQAIGPDRPTTTTTTTGMLIR